jgi:tetratricopeptide (TPR) repeat protein
VLRSGDQNRHLVRVSRFVRTWQGGEYWGIVALRPGEMPAVPDADKFIRSVATVEAVGDFESAVLGYHAATERWPQKPLAWLGLGNVFYAQGDLESAEAAYKRLLAIDPDNAVALNNLSQVQADRGSFKAASATLDMALSVTEPNTAMHQIIEESRQQIESRHSRSD